MIINLREQYSLDALFYIAEKVAKENGIVGLYSGAWDLCHVFHRQGMEQARRMCDFLIIGVGTDRLVRENKGKDRPFFPEQQRLYMIDTLKAVDACFLMDSEKEYSIVANELMTEKYHGVTFKPYDEWLERRHLIPGFDEEADYLPSLYTLKGINVEQYRIGNVVFIPRNVVASDSTTGMIKDIRNKK